MASQLQQLAAGKKPISVDDGARESEKRYVDDDRRSARELGESKGSPASRGYLSDEASRAMLTAVSEFGLWNRPDFRWNSHASDGALWLVEGRQGDTYHPALLINADREAVEKLAAVVLQMAGIDPVMLHGGAEIRD